MESAGVDVFPTQASCGLVENLLVGPSVLENILYVVIVLVAPRCVRGQDGVICLEVAVIERAIRVDGEIDGNKRQMTRGVEDVNVHYGSVDEEGPGR